MKAYPKYKDSGIEWIGEIPEGWDVKKLKYFSIIETGNTPPKKEALNYCEDGVPWVKPDNLKDLIPIVDSEEKISPSGMSRARIIPSGSILVCCIGTIGKIGVAGCDLTTNQQINSIIFNSNIIDSNYGKYLLFSSEQEHQRISNRVVVSILNKTNQSMIKFPVPLIKEQLLISKHLDKHTPQIEEFISKKEKLIELLTEKRQALINNAVTKGINPKAKMKDTEIEWIGKIPEVWDLTKIKYNTYVKGRVGWHGLSTSDFIEKGLNLVTGTDFNNGIINWQTCYHISKERYDEDPYIQLKENDLLITKDGTIGKVAVVKNLPDKATLNSGIFVVRPLEEKYISDYMSWLLNSQVFQEYISYTKTGSALQHLYQETFENFSFPLPPLPEQQQIVDYIETETSKIDKTINKIEKEIELLKEYKTSLIYEAVTGKIDLRSE